MKRYLAGGLAAVFLAICAVGWQFDQTAHSQTLFEQLVMPGELTEAHKHLEKTCNSCHAAFSKDLQPGLCLDCHKDIAKDIKGSIGFHGRSEEVGGKPCKACHTDHAGRTAAIVVLDQKTFPHDLTDFVLKGKHQKIACKDCHAAKAKFRDAPSDCIACHRKDDKHKGGLGAKCESCHVETDWKTVASFDHSKTRFPLHGAHQKTTCQQCHAGEKYRGVPMTCIGCHQKQDVHKGSLGKKCESCHNETDWKKATSFDHSKTRFPLNGAHQKTTCQKCHGGGKYRGVPVTCIGCHQKQDVHEGSLGKKCGSCHNESDWKRVDSFDHSKTRFPLEGAHRKTKCESCHKEGVGKKLDIACVACHQKEDVHKGALGKRCESCHNAKSWKDAVAFDHSKTRFPLRGLHVDVGCKECHKSASYKDAPTDCAACHVDRIHKGRLGPRCEQCHSAKGWPFFHFDHDADTQFALTGAHRKVGCHECHKAPVAKVPKLPTTCVACHAADDVHRGSFGNRCEKCHSTKSFKVTNGLQ